MIGRILGLGTAARGVGEAVGGVAEVLLGNRAEREAAEHERFNRVPGQFGAEFIRPTGGRFDGFVNGLNRLPRPMMALGTLVLFIYAMVDPAGFAARMQGLGYVPEPLWWLLGAVVSFYFGARELHHYRGRQFDLPPPPPSPRPVQSRGTPSAPPPSDMLKRTGGGQLPAGAEAARSVAEQDIPRTLAPDYNAALEEWKRGA